MRFNAMGLKVSRDFEDAFIFISQQYCDEVEETVKEEITAVSRKTSQILRHTSPDNKDTSGAKKYNRGWKYKIETGRNVVNGKVYNANKPGLAHLLELGHGPGKRGWAVEAKPHINKAAEWATSEIIRRLHNKL